MNSSFQAGDAVGFALADGEDRAHSHAVSGHFSFGSKHVAAAGGANTDAALRGAQPLLGFLNATDNNSTGMPFLQLTACRFSNATSPAAGAGTGAGAGGAALVLPAGAVSLWDPATVTGGCPAPTAPLQAAAGRLLAATGSPALIGAGFAVSAAAPLEGPGTAFSHTHAFSASVSLGSTDFVGIDGCCNNNPASDGSQTATGTSSAGDTAVPYLSILVCNTTTAAGGGPPLGAPPGLVFLSVAGAPCPAGWAPLPDAIGGRFVVGTPQFGVPMRVFGGAPIAGAGGAGGAWQPQHTHGFEVNLATTPAGIGLATGCCAHGYGKSGQYTARGATAEPDPGSGGDVPWLLVQACVANATAAVAEAWR